MPVFFRDAHLSGPSSGGGGDVTVSLTTQVAGAWGSAATVVGCPVTNVSDGGSGDNAEFSIFAARAGASNADSWEAPPGTPSRVVFSQMDIDESNTSSIQSTLAVATSESACGAPEAKVLLTTGSDAGGSIPDIVYNARFSPDGNRIVYVSNVQAATRVSRSGSTARTSGICPRSTLVGDAGLDPDAAASPIPSGPGILGPVVPHWKDATHVGWVSFVGDTASTVERSDWELWVVEDKANATPELAMRCNGSGLTHFDFAQRKHRRDSPPYGDARRR